MKRKDIKTLKDLYNYFKGIPKSRWAKRSFTEWGDSRKHCALGHLGKSSDDCRTEDDVFNNTKLYDYVAAMYYRNFNTSIMNINDHYTDRYPFPEFNQSTPKERILASVEYLMKDLGEDFSIRSIKL